MNKRPYPKIHLLLAMTVLLYGVAPPAHAGPTKTRAKVTVFLMPQGEIDPKKAARVTHAIVKAMHDNGNLKVKDPDKLLVEFAGEIPSRTISRAKSDLKKGIFLIKGGNANEAAAKLRGSLAGLEEALAFVKKSLLARAYMALGVALAEAGRRKEAYNTFVRLLVWRPRVRYNTSEFGSRHLPLFARAQEAARRLPRGSVELATEPNGAKAYVDGRFVGITPTTAFGVTSGVHYATFKREGYIKASKRIEVSGTMQKKYSKELKSSDKYLLLKQSLETAKGELGKKNATQAMTDLRSFLFIDQVVFARVRQLGDGQLHVQAYLYDLRSKQLLNQATQTIPGNKLSSVKKLTGLLYVNVRYDGSLAAPEEPPPPPPPKRTPFYKTWWFWSAVAVGTAAIVVPSIVIPGQTTSCEDGSRCITIRN